MLKVSSLMKKLIVGLIVFVICFNDFFVLSNAIFSYAAESFSEDISYDFQFVKNDNSEMSIEVSIDVPSDRYFKNGKLIIKDLDGQIFQLKDIDDIEKNEIIQTIDGNKIKLRQLNSGLNYKFNLPIVFKDNEFVNIDALQKGLEIELIGSYLDTNGNDEIISKICKSVLDIKNVYDLVVDTKVIKCIPYVKNEEKEVLVQIGVLIGSDDKFILPIKNTKLEFEIPHFEGANVKDVSVSALNTIFTNGQANGDTKFDVDNWKYENEKVVIELDNIADSEKYKIGSKYDEYIISFVYSNIENVELESVSSRVTAEVTDFTTTGENVTKLDAVAEYDFTKGTQDVVTYDVISKTKEINKGYIYANINAEKPTYSVEYENLITANISRADIVKMIEFREKEEYFQNIKGKKYSSNNNTHYKAIRISKNELFSIIGDNGNFEVLLEDETLLATIDKTTQIDDEFIVINFDDDTVNKVLIRINSPEKEGILNIRLIKAIEKTEYDAEDIKEFTTLGSTFIAAARLDEKIITEMGNKQVSANLLDTTTHPTILVNRNEISSLVKNENVEIGILLNNADKNSDMYQNPVFELVFPNEIENVEVNDFNLLYGNDELEISNVEVLKNDVNQVVVRVSLSGTQTGYVLGYSENGTTIVLDTNIDVNMLTADKKDKIFMNYYNEDVTNYAFSGSKMILNSISNTGGAYCDFNVKAPEGMINGQIVSYDDKQMYSISQGQKEDFILPFTTEKFVNEKMVLINNTGKDAEGVSILGRLPFGENKKLYTQLSSLINADVENGLNGVIYYSENADANDNLSDANNGWILEPVELSNIKSYMIIFNEAVKNGEVLKYSFDFKIPENVGYSAKIYSDFQTIYTQDEIRQNVVADRIGFITEDKPEVIVNEEKPGNDMTIIEEDNKPNVNVETPFNNSKLLYLTFDDSISGVSDVHENDEFEYVLQIRNGLRDRVSDISAQIELPNGIEFVKSYLEEFEENGYTVKETEFGEFDENSGLVNYFIDGLESSEYRTIKVRVKVKELENTEISKSIVASAKVTSNNEFLYVLDDITKEVVKPKLEINVHTNHKSKYIKEGEIIEYYFNIRNIGGEPARDVKFDYKLPEEIKGSEASIIVDDKTKFSSINENGEVHSNFNIDSGKEAVVVIKAVAKDIPNNLNEKMVKNKVNVSVKNGTEEFLGEIENIIEQNSARQAVLDKSVEVEKVVEDVKPIIPQVTTEVKKIESVENVEEAKYKIIGKAFLDSNKNGQKDKNEKMVGDVVVKLYDADSQKLIEQVVTNSIGEYIFDNVSIGEYYLKFEYDNQKYQLTDYKKKGVDLDKNSDAIMSNNSIITDKIKITDTSISDIDIGLVKAGIFDLSLDASISNVIIQDYSKTKSYSMENTKLGKVDINSQYIENSKVYIEYTISVTNNGEIAGYAKSIVDYLPDYLTLDTSLNPDWYVAADGNAYTEKFEKELINPGETKTVTLILMKQMTENNTGIINNTFEIAKSYNEYAIEDIDSIEGNSAQGEDDMSTVDMIIGVETGIGILWTTITTSILIILLLIFYIIKAYFDFKNREIVKE